MALPNFISDEEMASLESSQKSSSPNFISDAEMQQLESSSIEQPGYFTRFKNAFTSSEGLGSDIYDATIGGITSLAKSGYSAIKEAYLPGSEFQKTGIGSGLPVTAQPLLAAAYNFYKGKSPTQAIYDTGKVASSFIPVVGPLAYDKAQQAINPDVIPSTTPEEDARATRTNTIGTVLPLAAVKATAKTAAPLSKLLAKNSAELDRKSIGAQYGDYKKTANDLQLIDTPSGSVETLTKTAIDDLLKSDELPISRHPEDIIKFVDKKTTQLSGEVRSAIEQFDKAAPGTAPKVTFDNALNYIENHVPANEIDSYLGKLAKLEEGITKEGKGRLSYLQDQKIAIGKKWDAGDATLNEFNRALYSDLQKTIESVVPEVGPLNREIQKYKILEPITRRALAVKEGSDPISRLINITKTTGGFGVPIAASTYAFGPVVGPAVGYAIGKSLSGVNNYAALSNVFEKGAKISNSASKVANITSPLTAGISGSVSAGSKQLQSQAEGRKRQELSEPKSQAQKNQINRKEIPYLNSKSDPVGYAIDKAINKANGRSTEDNQVNPLVEAVKKVESSGNPNAVSKKGAVGVMQLMPETAKEVAQKLGLNKYDLKDPKTNELLGTVYLNEKIANFKGNIPLALAAYNAGEAKVRKWIRQYGPTWKDISEGLKKDGKYSETVAYVPKVQKALRELA